MMIIIHKEGTSSYLKALLHVFSDYLNNIISFSDCNFVTHSLESLILDIPTIRIVLGKTASQESAPQKWNGL